MADAVTKARLNGYDKMSEAQKLHVRWVTRSSYTAQRISIIAHFLDDDLIYYVCSNTISVQFPLKTARANVPKCKICLRISQIGSKRSTELTAVDTEDWTMTFLKEYAVRGNITKAANIAGIQPSTVHARRRRDSVFEELFLMTQKEYVDSVNEEVRRRGIDGWEEDVYGRVEDGSTGVVGKKRVYSDRLLEIHAKAVDPRYRDKTDITIETNRADVKEIDDRILALIQSALQRKKAALPEAQPIATELNTSSNVYEPVVGAIESEVIDNTNHIDSGDEPHGSE